MKEHRELYRSYDAAGRLLYVGVSLSARIRIQDHFRTSDWFDDVVRIDLERFVSAAEALKAEGRAIRNENPVYNKVVSYSCAGRPLAKDAHKALARTKPWVAEGMSRRTWFRRRAKRREG